MFSKVEMSNAFYYGCLRLIYCSFQNVHFSIEDPACLLPSSFWSWGQTDQEPLFRPHFSLNMINCATIAAIVVVSRKRICEFTCSGVWNDPFVSFQMLFLFWGERRINSSASLSSSGTIPSGQKTRPNVVPLKKNAACGDFFVFCLSDLVHFIKVEDRQAGKKKSCSCRTKVAACKVLRFPMGEIPYPAKLAFLFVSPTYQG